MNIRVFDVILPNPPPPREVEIYGIRQAAEAAGVSVHRINVWLDRGFAPAAPAYESPGIGRVRLFTRERIYQLALAARLIANGLSVKQASYLALFFSDIAAEGKAFIAGDESPNDEREPGGLFADETTVFRVLFHRDGTATASVDRASAVTGDAAFTDGARAAQEAWLLNMNRLVARVNRALGLPVAADDPRCNGADMIVRTND